MCYIEGNWIPEESERGKTFDGLFRRQNLKSNFTDLKGVLINWSEDENLFDGLALGIEDNLFFRMLNKDAIEVLTKERKLINL